MTDRGDTLHGSMGSLASASDARDHRIVAITNIANTRNTYTFDIDRDRIGKGTIYIPIFNLRGRCLILTEKTLLSIVLCHIMSGSKGEVFKARGLGLNGSETGEVVAIKRTSQNALSDV
jgi:hypothetical protein